MANGIYAALSGALNNMRQIDVVSHNLANASTPAFKIERLATGAVAPPANSNGELIFAMPAVKETDLRQGPLVATDDPMDIALAEGTYLQVSNGGTTSYMRGATLSVMPDGTLSTLEGHAVFGDDNIVRIPPGAREIVIGDNGDVVVDGNRVDRLRLVSFNNEQALGPGSGRTLIANGAVPSATAASAPVMAGYQEKPNVSMIKQMTDMIAAHRLYDVTMSAIRTHGQVESKAAREIAGRF